MRIAVQNNAGGSPNQAEIQQNLGNAGGFVTGGQSYTFSFQAKQISSGVSYVQQYRLQWYDDNNVAIPGADIGFTGFSGGNGTWTKIEVPAPAPRTPPEPSSRSSVPPEPWPELRPRARS